MEHVNITVVGAGVIGLAVASELSHFFTDVLVIEKNPSFGQETSSRNSEVIHAGIYYPQDSLKAKTCIEGKQLLYEYCKSNNIGHRKIGKLIVATNSEEIGQLECLLSNGLKNGLKDLVLLTKNEVKKFEPYVKAEAALYSPSTGILDSHGFMKHLALTLKAHGAEIAYNAELIGIEKINSGFHLSIRDANREIFTFISRVVVNSAGLYSDKTAALAGIERSEYRLKYCKGDYFRVHSNKAQYINRLVYPVPKQTGAGLGIHATLDLAGSLRLGPDDEYVEVIDYTVNKAKQMLFYESVRQFLPFIECADLKPDTSGIRPKLKGPLEDFRDFIIKDEGENGLYGFINLVGIESPGLTSSLAIARMVKEMLQRL